MTVTDAAGSAGTATFSWSVRLAIIIPDPGTVRTTAGHALNVRLSYSDAAGRADRVTLFAPACRAAHLRAGPGDDLRLGQPARDLSGDD